MRLPPEKKNSPREIFVYKKLRGREFLRTFFLLIFRSLLKFLLNFKYPGFGERERERKQRFPFIYALYVRIENTEITLKIV